MDSPAPKMSYKEAVEFLYKLQQFGANLGLERAFKLAELAGRPQDKLNFIHVAGTNGKGSTCAMLESIYRHSGYKVGFFTSPHLISFTERIQVNRKQTPRAAAPRLPKSSGAISINSPAHPPSLNSSPSWPSAT